MAKWMIFGNVKYEFSKMEKVMFFINDNLWIHTSLNRYHKGSRARCGEAPWLMMQGGYSP